MNRIQVDEEKLLNVFKMNKFETGQEDDQLKKVLNMGEIFRKEGLTPFYIHVSEGNKSGFIVTSQEAMDNKLH